jgi:hypothetical protein
MLDYVEGSPGNPTMPYGLGLLISHMRCKQQGFPTSGCGICATAAAISEDLVWPAAPSAAAATDTPW